MRYSRLYGGGGIIRRGVGSAVVPGTVQCVLIPVYTSWYTRRPAVSQSEEIVFRRTRGRPAGVIRSV